MAARSSADKVKNDRVSRSFFVFHARIIQKNLVKWEIFVIMKPTDRVAEVPLHLRFNELKTMAPAEI